MAYAGVAEGDCLWVEMDVRAREELTGPVRGGNVLG